MKKQLINLILSILFLTFLANSLNAQSQSDSTKNGIASRIFLPSIEVGYMFNNSEILGGGVIVKTSIELRNRNNNDFFFRINYDPYASDYSVEDVSGTTNIINGEVQFTDLLGGLGYRFGENKFRYFLMFQPGIKFYNVPTAVQSNNVVNVELDSRNIFTTRATLGFEYYFNEKAALSVDVFHNQVWRRVDFWPDRGDAIGFSIGVITALF